MKATKKKSVILAAAMAVLMILMSVYGLKASAEEAAAEAPQDAVVLTEEAAGDEVEVLAEGEENAAPKSNGLATGIVLVVAVGAIAICLREIRRDNKRP